MFSNKWLVLLSAAVPALAGAQAQSVNAVPIVAERLGAPAAGPAVLPPNTDLLLRLDAEVNSKKARVGDKFSLTLVQDVVLGNFIVIPRGARATGEVSYRTGKGAFGKSAKMEIDLRSIDVGGRTVPISGHYRQEGTGNTGATVGAAVAVGPFAAFVTGRSAIFPQGRELRASTREAVEVAIPQ